MTSVEQAAAMAVGLPGAVRRSHFGNVDFRVRNRIFASFPAPDQITLRLDPEHARVLAASDPATFAAHPGVWGERGWTRLTLSHLDSDDLADLIHESWRGVAPRRLLACDED